MGDCPRYRHGSTMNVMNSLNKSEYCTAWKMLFDCFNEYEVEIKDRINNLRQAIQMGTFYNTNRNDTCPCGSKKKFKKCCGRAPLAL
jgi:uncharacterized protein YecA (UPF0149 family)